MAISQNFPDLTPSLNLNFAGSKKLDSRVTFTRGSTGTYMDDNGIIKTAGINQPRFDHSYNGTSVESLGLLIEESRTNLITHSEDLSSGSPFNTTVTSNVTTAPDGTNTADLLTEASDTSQQHGVQFDHTVSTINYTISAYFKEPPTNSRRYVTLTMWGMGYVAFDIQTGSVVQSYGGGIISSGIYPVGNGWYRAWVNYLKDNTNQGSYVILHNGTNGGHLYNGGGSLGMYVWGFQVEAGTFPTSIIKTSGSSATRSADNATITGTNFSNWYNPTEGSVLCNARLLKVNSGTGQVYWSIGDSSTFNESIYQANDTTNIGINMIDGGSNQFGAGGSTITDNSFNKTSVAYKLNDSAASFNGSSPTTDTSCTIPTVNSIRIGSISWGVGNFVNGTISQVSYYPKRLTNTELQNLTK